VHDVGNNRGVTKATDEGWQFWWRSSREPVPVETADQLDVLITTAFDEGAGDRSMAELTAPSGASLAIGLSNDESIATFCESYADPPYYLSRGDEDSDNPIVFFYDGHWSEFPRRAAVPAAAAVAAAREFFHTGRRPRLLAWDEV
jgi:Immunity protein Imm1